MNDLLIHFWEWFEIAPEQYSIEGAPQIYGHEEDDFPYFEQLLMCAQKIVDDNDLTEGAISDLLTIMAIDNESESVSEYIQENSSPKQLEQIVKIGIEHMQFNARWQLSEIIINRKPKGYFFYLDRLCHDDHPYVSSRAKSCMERVRYKTN